MALTIQWGNRDIEPPSLTVRQQSFDRAIEWFKTHEGTVFSQGNAALWWMVQTAADRTGNAYLNNLVRRSTLHFYGEADQAAPWRRMVYPDEPSGLQGVNVNELDGYQRFFLHAVTCQPVSLPSGDTTQYLKQNMCRPQWSQVWINDPVCSTHQLMGLRLIERARCQASPHEPQLKAELLTDIHQQMRWDVVMKDAYIQRVLMLYWAGSPDLVKPVWLNRVFAAQQLDGGWNGAKQIPELPAWGQPGAFKTRLAAWFPWLASQKTYPMSDFHATAQGLLLAALSLGDQAQSHDTALASN